VPRVGEHRAVLHAVEVLAAQDVARAGHRDEHVAALGGGQGGQDVEALHPRLERAQRVDLADDDRRAGAAGAGGDTAAGPAVAEHDDRPAREEQVGRADDAVERALPGAEAVVQRALGARLVHREDGARELGPEGAQVREARAGLLRRAAQARVERRDERRAVVEDEVGLEGGHRLQTFGVVAGEDVGPQGGGDVGLRGQRVGGAEIDVRTALAQGEHEVRRLGGDVQAGADPDALERPVGAEAGADRAQDGHLPARPLDPRRPLRRRPVS
jgi:hypothetical protein